MKTSDTAQDRATAATAPVEFNLFAPTIEWAALQGDFNNWQDTEMVKGEDGYFRTTLDLPDGDYEYKFNIQSKSPWQFGQRVLISDPLATEVNESNGDNAIKRVRQSKVIIDEYQWRHDDAPLPANPEAVIYELHVGDFAGNFEGLINKLDYLSDLGVNTLELLPVVANPGSYSWGYMPRHFQAVENSYGGPADFKRLVDECHGRGMRVILDLVLNHAEPESPLVQIDHNYWFVEHNTDKFQFGPKFDYVRFDEEFKIYPARQLGHQVTAFWVSEYHLDGIRFDGTYLIANFDFLREAGETVRQAASMKPVFVIAEHIPLDTQILQNGMPFESAWNNTFLYQVGANLVEKNFGGVDAFNWDMTRQAIQPALGGIPGPAGAVNYIANHDQHHFWHELELNGITGDKAFRKQKLGLAIMFTAVGLPLLWQGEEFGEYSDKSMDPRPPHFELLDQPKNREIFEQVKKLAYLRKTHGALKSDKLEFIHQDEQNKVLAWKRWDEAGNVLVVVVNFSDQPLPGYVVPNVPDNLNHEYLFDYPVQPQGGSLTGDLGPSEAKIFLAQ